MKKVLFAVLLFAISCNQKTEPKTESSTEKDPHTFSEPDKAVVKHLDLDIKVNFENKQISGKASWSISNIAKTDHIIFDTKLLDIQKVTVSYSKRFISF